MQAALEELISSVQETCFFRPEDKQKPLVSSDLDMGFDLAFAFFYFAGRNVHFISKFILSTLSCAALKYPSFPAQVSS